MTQPTRLQLLLECLLYDLNDLLWALVIAGGFWLLFFTVETYYR